MQTTVRGLKPYVMTNLKTNAGLAEVVALIETNGMLQAAYTKFLQLPTLPWLVEVRLHGLEAWQSG